MIYKLFFVFAMFLCADKAQAVAWTNSDFANELISLYQQHDDNEHDAVVKTIDMPEDGAEKLPRILRGHASSFLLEVQLTPIYTFEGELLTEQFSPSTYKNLVNPPKRKAWFVTKFFSFKSSRISGWKDGNSLYAGRITYYS